MTSAIAVPRYGAASGTSRRGTALARARRHTRFVKLLRLALPLLALAILAAPVVPLFLRPAADLPDVDVAGFGLSGSGITMQHPRLTGFSAEKRPYEISADRAEQTLATPDNLGLFGILARMETSDGGWARLASKHGVLQSKAQLLDLDQTIEVTTDRGDRANLERAHVNLTTGEILSDQSVALASGTMNLTADRMHVAEGGAVARFEGRVVMTVYPQPDSAGETAQ